ncbi:MAG TPA: hypothetical protein VGI39_25560, partial [Polyangiaceae bacterium]
MIACAATAGEWTTDGDPHLVHPPAGEATVGHVAVLKVAPNSAGCAVSTVLVDLVVTAHAPQIDPGSVTLNVDEGRLELRGRSLRGIGIHWQQSDHAGDDRCAQPEAQAGGLDRCAFSVGRGLSADPNGASLSWFPAGGRAAGPEVTTFDANGRRVGAEELSIRPARVLIASLVPPNVSIDLVGDASRVPLQHPEAVGSADCGAASCQIEGGALVVRAVRNLGQTLAVRVRLAPHVFFAKGDTLDPAPSFQVAVLPCAMSIASGEALRGVDDSKVVVKLDTRCAAEANSLRFSVGSQTTRTLKVVNEGGAAYVLLRVGRVEGDEIAVTALRGDTDSSMVGVARIKTRAAPQPRATLELAGGGAIDFIPTNRKATVRFANAEDHERVALLPLEGVYEVLAGPKTTEIHGLPGADGYVALHFAYRVDTLPSPLDAADLAVLVDPVERALKEANVPAPLGASAMGPLPLVDLTCDDGSGQPMVLKPGTPAHIPFSSRDSCRITFHKDRLAPELGSQKLTLDIDVTRVDGESRSAARVSQPIVLRPGGEPRLAWIKG